MGQQRDRDTVPRDMVAGEQLTVPSAASNTEPAWHLFVLQHPRRDEIRARLSHLGIETLIHYPIPPPRSPAYGLDTAWDPFPLAEHLAASAFSVPMSPHHSKTQIEVVSQQVANAIRQFE